MGDFFEISVRPGDVSLAAWVLALQPGSTCFCCGRALDGFPASRSSDQDIPLRLECLFCGAEVINCEALDPQEVHFSPREHVLAAA